MGFLYYQLNLIIDLEDLTKMLVEFLANHRYYLIRETRHLFRERH